MDIDRVSEGSNVFFCGATKMEGPKTLEDMMPPKEKLFMFLAQNR